MRVTVGIPVFNAERTLEKAVRSVFAQTHPDWKLLLVDDGSADGSVEIARSIADPRVVVLADGHRRGLANRLNQIAALSDTELIARLDADDLMHPDRLRKQVEFLVSNPAVQVVGTATFTVDERGAVVGKRGNKPLRLQPDLILKHGLFVHPTVMMRRAWALENPYDPRYERAEDRELWCRISPKEVALIPEHLYFYREVVPVNIRAYSASCRTNRRILARYGPRVCGWRVTARLIAGTLAKECVYRLFGVLGLQRLLLMRRNSPLVGEEKHRANSILAGIAKTVVPGLDERSRDSVAEKVRIVMVATAPQFLLFFAGQPRFLSKEYGYEVHTVSSDGDELARFASVERVVPHVVSMQRRITPLRDIIALAQLTRLFLSIRPSIVHSHTPKAGLLGMVAATLARVPTRIYSFHGLRYVTCMGFKRRLLRLGERLACGLAHRVLTVSQSIREFAIADGVCSSAKARVLLDGSVNGVDATGAFQPMPQEARRAVRSSLGIPEDARVIGFIGRVVRDKGIRELTFAWRRLRDEFADLRLLIVGPIEDEDPIPTEVRQCLASDSRVHLLGVDWDTPRLYAAIDILALPSYREGFPVVVIEAAAMEVPVVATLIPGCVDAVQHGITGTLVPPRDTGALAEALRSYLLDPVLRSEHGSAARARALSRFQQRAMWTAVGEEYRSAVQEKRDARARI